MSRSISFTEVSTALDCMARHAFQYTGHLTDGDALKPKALLPALSEGRAWGAGVATWHKHADRTDGIALALDAIDRSLDADADEQREHGVHDPEHHAAMAQRLWLMFDHYQRTDEPLPVFETEVEIDIPIPSRTGVRRSSRYRLHAYVDGVYHDGDGVWLLEHKLRRALHPVAMIAMSRQIRWYAWAYWRQTGHKPLGVTVDERWNELPKPARILQSGKPSHDKAQLCLPGDYIEACRGRDIEPHEDVVEALEHRRWQQRTPVLFRDSELDEVEDELVTAAKLIGQLDRGELLPLRNVKRSNCNGCRFREICPNPDTDLVDALFVRQPPKRDQVSA